MKQGRWIAVPFFFGDAFTETFNLAVIKRLMFPSACSDRICFSRCWIA
jgi:hypothetical protein